jgi:DNA-binding GntR family transcriptional regulator
VREALRALAAEGWVLITPRRGASVAALSREAASEMIEVRATLEGLNARLAARHRTERTLAALQQVLREGNQAAARSDAPALLSLNARFHDLLGEAGSNALLRDMLRMLRERTTPLFAPMSRRRWREIWEEHAAILSAVLQGDEDLAALLAARHVTSVGTHVLSHLEAAAEAQPGGAANRT